jgi:hypothetical protein
VVICPSSWIVELRGLRGAEYRSKRGDRDNKCIHNFGKAGTWKTEEMKI